MRPETTSGHSNGGDRPCRRRVTPLLRGNVASVRLLLYTPNFTPIVAACSSRGGEKPQNRPLTDLSTAASASRNAGGNQEIAQDTCTLSLDCS